MMPPPKLRFGFVHLGDSCPTWTARSIHKLLNEGLAELVVEVRVEQPAAARPRAVVEHYFERWVRPRSEALRPTSLGLDVRTLRCNAEIAADECTLPQQAVDALDAAQLDFVLVTGVGALAGAGPSTCPLGVWSLTPADDGREALWSILDGEAACVTELVATSPAGAVTLDSGRFSVCAGSWLNTLDGALLGAEDFLRRACKRLAARRGEGHTVLVEFTQAAPRAPRRPAPTTAELRHYMRRAVSAVFKKLWQLGLHVEVWNVGVADVPSPELCQRGVLPEDTITWYPEQRRGQFIADPFSYAEDGEHHVLVEDYECGGKGRICRVLDNAPGQPLQLEPELEPAYHLSYPYIFLDDGVVYCLCEAYQSRKVSLLRRTGNRWELAATLLEGQPVVDPTLFKHRGRYWLFHTLQDDRCWGNLKLHAHYADALEGPWTPHSLNPIKCDIGSSRPAGTALHVGEKLYRPSQDCSRTYGGAVVINEVRRLTPDEFEEVEVARLEPPRDGPYPDGLHTINPFGTKTLMDGKRWAFDWSAWWMNRDRFHEVFR